MNTAIIRPAKGYFQDHIVSVCRKQIREMLIGYLPLQTIRMILIRGTWVFRGSP